jgi:hypothetical protein
VREKSARIKPRRADKVEGVFKLLIFYLGMTETDFENDLKLTTVLLFSSSLGLKSVIPNPAREQARLYRDKKYRRS